jgi:DNA polymerase III delta prime subunit
MELDFNFNNPKEQQEMKEQILVRAIGILKHEGVEYDEAVVKELVERYGTSIRELYSMLQKYYKLYGKIDANILKFTQVDEKLIDLLKEKKVTEARTLINQKGWSDVDVYRFLFDKYVPTCQKKGSAILTIAQYEGIGATSRLPDIQLAACLISLIGLE